MKRKGLITSVLLAGLLLTVSSCSDVSNNGVKKESASDEVFASAGITYSPETEAKFSAILEELYRSNWQAWWKAPDPEDDGGYSRLFLDQYGSYPGRLRFGPKDSIGNCVFTGKVKPTKELSEKERMLLSRVALWQESGLKHIQAMEEYNLRPIGFSIFGLGSELLAISESSGITTLSSDALELVTDTPVKRSAWVKFYEQNPRLCLLSLSARLSPITGKPIRLDAKEFSPGNAYFEIITDRKVLRRLFSGERAKHFNPGSGFTYLYFRVYGEDSIIAEGIDVSRSAPPEGNEGTSTDFWPCPSGP